MNFPIKVTIIVLAALAIALGISICSRKTHIKFIVPKDFRGVVTIAERTRGVVPKRDPHNAWVFDIPADGRLIISDASSLEDWHTEEAQYSDGTKLPVYQMDPGTLNSQQVMFFTMEAHGNRTWYFFVGTESEYRNALPSSRPAVPDDQ